MKFAKANEKYEDWLGRRLRLIDCDLEQKHKAMRSGLFPFLRATYFRWAQTWKDVCGAAARGPQVLAAGDLHVENFGTWRDKDGRLIWGVNDFDEAAYLPYANDLVRLATSVQLAEMNTEPRDAVAAILKGYAECLTCGGREFVLAEHHAALHRMAFQRLHDPASYWDKLCKLPETKDEVPDSALKAIDRMMPERGLKWKTVQRIAGLGSLGRERWVGLVEWRGGFVAREVKALAPAASVWAAGDDHGPILYQKILDGAVRCPDPFVRLHKRWIARRLAPDCSRIELSALPKQREELRLLRAMGFETANVHLGSVKARVLMADLKKRPRNWLPAAAHAMEKAVREDFKEWAES